MNCHGVSSQHFHSFFKIQPNNQRFRHLFEAFRLLALDATETLMISHLLPALGPSFKGGGQKDDPNIKVAIRLSSC